MKIGNGKSSFFLGWLIGGAIAVSEKTACKKESKLYKFGWLNETWPTSIEWLPHCLEYLVTCGS